MIRQQQPQQFNNPALPSIFTFPFAFTLAFAFVFIFAFCICIYSGELLITYPPRTPWRSRRALWCVDWCSDLRWINEREITGNFKCAISYIYIHTYICSIYSFFRTLIFHATVLVLTEYLSVFSYCIVLVMKYLICSALQHSDYNDGKLCKWFPLDGIFKSIMLLLYFSIAFNYLLNFFLALCSPEIKHWCTCGLM